MYVIEVIPLKRGIQTDTLSYFSGTKYPEGSILSIPIKNSHVLGIVSSITEASTTKTALRAATFSLRRLPHQNDVQTLSAAFIKTATELSAYYACSKGALLHNFLPPQIRNGEVSLPRTHHIDVTDQNTPEILQGTKKERYTLYRSLVRETFAHSGSVVCVAPTSAEADELYTLLSSGISERVILLTSSMTKKQIEHSFDELEDFSKSKLIITTPSYALLERHDVTLVIIEHARSPYFKDKTRPYVDRRDALRVHAKYSGRRLIMGDILPRSEEEFERQSEHYLTLDETPKRIELNNELTIVQMKDKPDGSEPFRLFSSKVIDAIHETQKKRGQIFLFAAHRGLAPVVACIDCGHIFRSPESGAPYSLVRTHKNGKEERWFVSGTSGGRIRAADTCTECGSWRLREKGIGIQYVYDELTRILKGSPIILFDHSTAGTHKKASFLSEKFLSTKGSIMLGTQMALPYLHKNVTTSVIVNMDALYATPTWRLQEENLALLLTLREKTDGVLYVQTRIKDDHLLKQAKQGAVQEFYTEELELRKTFNYPPFTTFIHLTWQGSREILEKIETRIEQTLTDFGVTCYNAPPTPKGITTKYGLVRVASKDWPDSKLGAALRALPPSVRIVINPDRIV